MRWTSIALGVAGLAVLEGIVSRAGASTRVGGFMAQAGRALAWFISPAIPAFSTTPKPAAKTTTSATTTNSPNPSTSATAPALAYAYS